MSLHFAYGRSTLDSADWSIAVNDNGGNLTGATKYFSLQAQNPVGKNLQLISAPITFTTGDSITFTINSSALKAGEGWTHFVIGVSNSATSSSFNQVARINIYDMSTGYVDFDSAETFPLTLTLTEDSQLTTATFVDEKIELPTTNLVYGMRRGVTENNYIYEYNPFSTLTANNDDVIAASVGNWIKKEEFSCYVENINFSGGCAFDILNLGDFSDVELPTYNADGTNSFRVKYYLINNTGFTLQPGTAVTLAAQIGGIERTELFDGKIYYEINGIVTPSTGLLRTTSSITGQPLDFIGQEYTYTKSSPLTITRDYIQENTGLYIDLYVNFLNLEFNNLLPDGYLQIYLSYLSPRGVFTPVGTLFEKGIIYNKYNKRRVLPDVGLNVIAGEGEGLVKNFAWYSCNTTVSGLTANTANQKLYVNINGVVFPDIAERKSSVLRAIVDTTVKESKASSWTTYNAVTLNSALVVTVDYECDEDLNQKVRDSYPDVIAGDWAIFNPTRLNIYVQRQSDGEIRKFTNFIPAGANVSQDFIITDWSSGTIVTSVPGVSSSFFDPSTNSFSTTASAGNFTADNYRVAHTYVWNGDTVSDISHSVADGCISESQVNGEQVFGTTTYDTIAQIKAEDDLYDGLQLYCKNTQQLYVYDENSTLDDDDNFILLPDSGVGRWISTIIKVGGKYVKTTNPSVNDDTSLGYIIGDVWINTTNDTEYILFDNTVGGAVWKQITTQDSLNTKANINSPTFTGTPSAPTATTGTNTTQLATTAFVQQEIANINTSVDIAVTVASGEFRFNGAELADGLLLVPGNTYVFDLSDASNATHSLSFSTTLDGTHNAGSAYTTGITTIGTPGTDGILTFNVPLNAPETLYPYCPNHALMGGSSVFNTKGGGASAANEVTVDATGFNGNLSPTDTTVQTALETIDGLTFSPNIVSRGTWNSGTSYAVNDVVNYTVNGNTYIANAPNTNKIPGTDPEWHLFAQKGDTGATGSQGATGTAATVTVGTVTTGASGSNVSVTNSGSSSAAVLNFTIPRGDAGTNGTNGLNADMTRTSSTSNVIGTGSKSFTFDTASSNLGWLVGTRLRATASAGNFMSGVVTTVSTTSVTINVDYTSGSGTYTSWNISIAGEIGITGSVSSASSLTLAQIATPSAPSAGNTLIYAKSDGGIYKRTAGGSEEAIGVGRLTTYSLSLSGVGANQTVTTEVFLPKSMLVYQIESSCAVRIRQYLDGAYRMDDLSRPSSTQIEGDHGCYYDLITKAEKSFIRNLAPPAIALSTGTGYFSIKNLESTTQNINIEIFALPLEV